MFGSLMGNLLGLKDLANTGALRRGAPLQGNRSTRCKHSDERSSRSPGNLHDGFGRDGAAARAALFVEKVQDFAQSVSVRGIPEIGAFPAHIDKADLL